MAGTGGKIGERQALIQFERGFQNDHATIWIYYASESFRGSSLSFEFPFRANVHTRIDAIATAFVAIAIANVLQSYALLFWSLDLHSSSFFA